MADISLVTDRTEDLAALISGLEGLTHRVTIRPMGLEAASSSLSSHVVIVDAVKDFYQARDVAMAIAESDEAPNRIVMVDPDHLDGIGPDWNVDTFILPEATPKEVSARVRLLRGRTTEDDGGIIRVGDLVIDPESYQVRIKARPLDLTYKEFQLLVFLAQRPGRVWSRQQLLQDVWGYDFFGGTRTVDVHVRRLRAKFGAEYESMIGTIRNVGYKLEARR